MGLSLVRIKGPHCKQSVNGKHIFVHCSITANLAVPMLHSSTQRSSANERIKSMWLEAKYEWCNKMLVSIWWSEDEFGKETVTSCALDVRLATISGFPTSAVFALTHAQQWVFSMAVKHSQSWGMGKTSVCSALVSVVPPAFMTLMLLKSHFAYWLCGVLRRKLTFCSHLYWYGLQHCMPSHSHSAMTGTTVHLTG